MKRRKDLSHTKKEKFKKITKTQNKFLNGRFENNFEKNKYDFLS